MLVNKERNIYKYFRIGDVVRNEEIWGNKLFVIHGFGGNWYLPELYVHPLGKEKTVGNTCNFAVWDAKLISSERRPLRKIAIKILLKLIKKGNEEAKRELIIRKVNKSYV